MNETERKIGEAFKGFRAAADTIPMQRWAREIAKQFADIRERGGLKP